MSVGTTSRRIAGAFALAAVACALAPRVVVAQLGSSPRTSAAGAALASSSSGPEARVWLDRGADPLLHTGDQVRIYYRTTRDAYVAIFHIDTDGTATLVFPSSPDDDHYVRGGNDYRVLFPRSPYWYVDDQPGLGYFFIVASPEPLDFSQFRFSRYDTGWDLGRVGRQVYRDPYVAMDDYVAALLPDWEAVPYALDFASYDVGQRFEYPRFLCYDCHGFRAYAAWNPYYAACTNFRVVIYDDPYFYPARRYRADRVVWVRPGPDRSRFAFKERAPGEPAAPLLEQVVGERTRGVLAPAPRRTPLNGAGGVAPTGRTPVVRQPAGRTPSGVVRGPADPYAPPARAPSEGTRQARPTDRVRTAEPTTGRVSPSGGVVVAPPRTQPNEAPARGESPGPGFAPTPDQRLRPVLRKRPSDAAGSPATAPSTGVTPSGGEARPRSPESLPPESRPSESRPREPRPVEPRPTEAPPPAPRVARPRTEAAPSSSGGAPGSTPRERPPATEQPSSGGSTSAPPRRGGDEAPTVRTTPDGRKVIRRPG